uniref:Uncharacterized protein n=1 Tax=Physcomitrium patens TaxID=3218 RepID=A0A2K1L716_PHYPA|nr:hypothetical protein PHYPA_000218 [Physcomitrium patens]
MKSTSERDNWGLVFQHETHNPQCLVSELMAVTPQPFARAPVHVPDSQQGYVEHARNLTSAQFCYHIPVDMPLSRSLG